MRGWGPGSVGLELWRRGGTDGRSDFGQTFVNSDGQMDTNSPLSSIAQTKGQRQRQRKRQRQRRRQRQRQRQRHRHIQRHTQTYIHTDIQTYRHTDIQT